MNCPRCKSTNVKYVDYLGSKFIICSDCGYDERDTCDIFAEERTSQKIKKEYNPYKAGGYFRTVK